MRIKGLNTRTSKLTWYLCTFPNPWIEYNFAFNSQHLKHMRCSRSMSCVKSIRVKEGLETSKRYQTLSHDSSMYHVVDTHTFLYICTDISEGVSLHVLVAEMLRTNHNEDILTSDLILNLQSRCPEII